MNTPILIKAAVSHYQFETVHPFLDGNGRLGRLTIILFLMQKQKLCKPILYLSDFFARHRMDYYDALDAVRFHNDIERWVKFFLVAVSETARHSCETLQKIIDLKTKNDKLLLTLGKRAQNATRLLEHMYSAPIVGIKQIAQLLGITSTSATALVKDLEGLGILNEMTGFSRNRLYGYSDYIDLFRL